MHDSSRSPADGPLFGTFLRYVIPSTLSLAAISTTGFVNSVVVGRFIGSDALAAISLLMPYITVLFAVALMLSAGGAVRVSLFLGAGDKDAASSVFSGVILAVFVIGVVSASLCNVFSNTLFGFLGGEGTVLAGMKEYFPLLSVALIVQLVSLSLYYFVRADECPRLATGATLCGALVNVALEWLLVGRLGLGLFGSALGTLIAQSVQLGVLATYFLRRRNLRPVVPRGVVAKLLRSAANGSAEGVNECSVGMVFFMMNTLLLHRYGDDGVAAWNILNAFVFVSLMIYYGVADTMPVLFCRNIGAGKWDRVEKFLLFAFGLTAGLALIITVTLVFGGSGLVRMFIPDADSHTSILAKGFVAWAWPMFAISGFNVLISCYLASLERALLSATVALLRALVLPLVFGIGIHFLMPSLPVIAALPAAEWTTFTVAAFLLYSHRPAIMGLRRPSGPIDAPIVAEGAVS